MQRVQSVFHGYLAVLMFAFAWSTNGAISHAADESTGSTTELGQRLYQQRCEACHGEKGAGDGPGARSVYPPPRNLRNGRFSLVSGANRVASREDVYRVIRDGMAGTSMKPFADLQESEMQALVDEVLRIRAAGMRDQYLEMCRQIDQQPEEAECEEYIAQRTTSSAAIVVPEFAAPDAQAIERGKLLFRQQGCSSCHGPRGIGTGDVALRDEAGNELRARDLAREPFKGGHASESIYRRIRLGFASGPMPSHSGLTESQLVDLVAYVQSLSRDPKRILTNHQMRRYVTRGLYVREFDTNSKSESKRK